MLHTEIDKSSEPRCLLIGVKSVSGTASLPGIKLYESIGWTIMMVAAVLHPSRFCPSGLRGCEAQNAKERTEQRSSCNGNPRITRNANLWHRVYFQQLIAGPF